MNLTGKGPMGLKVKVEKKNKFALKKVRDQKCVICEKFNEVQLSSTQAHHPIHDRHGTEKRPDYMAIPLCEGHHQGMFDTSKTAIHREPLVWRMKYGADYSYSKTDGSSH